MSLHHVSHLGAIGEIIALCGVGILWTFREQALEWVREFVDIWRGQISGFDPLLSDPTYNRSTPRWPRSALFLIGAMALLFIGQILFLIDIAF